MLGALNYSKNMATKNGLKQIAKDLDQLIKTGSNNIITARDTSATKVLLSNYATFDDSPNYSGMARDDEGNVAKTSVKTMGESEITTDLVLYKDGVPSYIADAMGDIKSLNISAKNYTDASRVHVLNKTSLYAILAMLNTNFANHYLNLIAMYNSQSQMAGAISSAEKEVKYAIAVRALSGSRNYNFSNNDSSNKIVDCLVINDRSKQRIIVLNIQDLLTKYNANNIENIISIKIEGASSLGNER